MCAQPRGDLSKLEHYRKAFDEAVHKILSEWAYPRDMNGNEIQRGKKVQKYELRGQRPDELDPRVIQRPPYAAGVPLLIYQDDETDEEPQTYLPRVLRDPTVPVPAVGVHSPGAGDTAATLNAPPPASS